MTKCSTTKITYSISDQRWSEAAVEPYDFSNITEAIQPMESCFEKQESGLICTICKTSIEEDRTDLIAHYKSEWHRHNLRRVLQGRPLLTEDEFEQTISDNNQLSSLDTESEDEIMPFTGGAHAYFVSDGTVYSIYRCILLKNEVISQNLFRRPLDCAILLLSAGHFCGGIFKNHELITNKSFHRYVVRAKQGTAQSASDARGSAAKSAGASVRRYNEKALKDEIQCLLANWSKLLEQSSLIFLRCPIYIFFEQTKDFKLEKCDERLRTIPFETRRPTVDELQRTWSRLKLIRSHGPVVNFNEEQERLKKLRQKQRRLFRRKISGVQYLSSKSSTESDNNDGTIDEIKQRQPEVVTNTLSGKKENSERSEAVVNLLSKANAQTLYASIRSNSIAKLHQLLESNEEREEDLLKYIREMRFPPASSTFLHIAARRGTVEILKELLLLGCDPAVKDGEGKVPYQVAQNRTVRQAFSKFRSEHPHTFNWNVSQIPELAVVSEEQLAKELEKKRIQREKKKQRDKAKKAAHYQERIEQEQRQKYLALSDREKRALAAERRIASSLQRACQIVENDGNRCFKCGAVLVPKHFEYCDNHFCSLACLQQHRQENPPQLVS
uniref:ANK_REP_REGION domain-containing protein n=1 Tax=Elaeophora elaphi TaxID=1147741 RepID=A0A0R3RFW0_9BILA